MHHLEEANEWLLRGARQHDKGCVAALAALSIEAQRPDSRLPQADIEATELAQLIAAQPAAEHEWLLALELELLELDEDALVHYQKASELGWTEAYADGAALLRGTKREAEADEWIRQGAALGDPTCQCHLALKVLEPDAVGAATRSEEQKAQALRHLIAAAEAGVANALLPLGTIYAQRKATPEQAAQAQALLTATILTAELERELEDSVDAFETHFPELGDNNDLPLRAGLDWLLTAVRETGRREASMLAVRPWVEFGLELPRA